MVLRPMLFCDLNGDCVKERYSFCEKYDISVKKVKKYLQFIKKCVIMVA